VETVAATAPYKAILLVDLKLRTYADIRLCLSNSDQCPQFDNENVIKALTGSGQWKERTTARQFGLYDTQVRILEKIRIESQHSHGQRAVIDP
jgi:hypothetical protein